MEFYIHYMPSFCDFTIFGGPGENTPFAKKERNNGHNKYHALNNQTLSELFNWTYLTESAG